MSTIDARPYGTGSASFEAAGGEAGIRQLVDAFYDRMGTDPRFAGIYRMHPADISISRDKLARFLCGWLGGPRRYQEKFGPIRIPAAHEHLPITTVERDQWLTCMAEAVDAQPFLADFKHYLMEQLAVPANAIFRRCSQDSTGRT
jgi:hemoglobin